MRVPANDPRARAAVAIIAGVLLAQQRQMTPEEQAEIDEIHQREMRPLSKPLRKLEEL